MELQPLDEFDTPATSWPGSGLAQPPRTQWTPTRIKSKRNNIVELILQQVTLALRGHLTNGHSFSQLRGWGVGIEQVLTENTSAIVDLQDVAAAMRTTLAYVGDEQQMVSVPRCLLTIPTISGSTSPPKSRNILDAVEFVYTGALHHSTLPVIYPATAGGSTLGTIYYTPIIADREGLVEGMAWIGGADTSIFSIDYYEIALCVLDVDTGMINKVWGSGNIKDAEASVNTSQPQELYKAIVDDTPQECAPGQILFAAHQQIAPGVFQTPRAIGAVPGANIARGSALRLDAWCYKADSHSQGIPSSISFAGLTRENRFCPWFGLRVAVLEDE
ncbi:hypothetical protein [Mycobacterium sp. SMC-4]|uniref:hypothetical protein n=1 Tax=Mycobacterium sp. SMC-4 TaxID=2857059 RepID=UPI0021B4040B|nr:hypothetical protein [Mycobacterium sp. SMC-4]UXA19560.1 hypothetical protein KXD98_08160 [Mycobacterium sp. SMC-4]